jgi:N-acetylglucosaminyldiphosphoundecaprenol N-acetyl-beta-D-mannosaminyltransferase
MDCGNAAFDRPASDARHSVKAPTKLESQDRGSDRAGDAKTLAHVLHAAACLQSFQEYVTMSGTGEVQATTGAFFVASEERPAVVASVDEGPADAELKPRQVQTGPGSVRLLGLEFADFDATAAAAAIARRAVDAHFGYVVTPNADHFVRLSQSPSLRTVYESAWLRLLDSRIVARAARLLGLRAPNVATGSDVMAVLLERYLRPDEPVTIIGLRPEWLGCLKHRYHLTNVAHYNPPMGFEHDTAAFHRTVEFALSHTACFTFLATGSPRQELLAKRIADSGQARGVGLCIGASLEFLSGAAARAPRWAQHAGLEWLHRLAGNPRRLARRYLWDDPRIFRLLVHDRIAAHRMSNDMRTQRAEHG